MRNLVAGLIAGATALALSAPAALSAGELVISANTSDAAPRAAFEEVIAKFRTANPDIDVEFNVIEHEAYKTAIRNFLVADEGPDVGFWFAGNRMAGFVEKGLFADISDVWADNGAGGRDGVDHAVDHLRRQAVRSALFLLPVGHLRASGHSGGQRRIHAFRDVRRPPSGLRSPRRQRNRTGDHRHEVPLDGGGVVRLREYADQRARLPYRVDAG